jgi:arylsulfatase A-like enzyme
MLASRRSDRWSMGKNTGKVFDILVVLTGLFILTEFLLLGIHAHAVNIDGMILVAMKDKLNYSLWPYFQFVGAHILLYAMFVYLLWFTVTGCAALFKLNDRQARPLAIILWFLSVAGILMANVYFVSHSFFAEFIQHFLFSDKLTGQQLKWIIISCAALCGGALLLAIVNACISLQHKQYRLQNGFALAFIVTLILMNGNFFHGSNKLIVSAATAERPNIFIIGFDALRPDFLNYFDARRQAAPNFNAFLKSSVIFTEALTPLARTFPSWTSIITSRHPLHTGAREDMVNLASLNPSATLANKLHAAGYATIYASDDNRFNAVGNKLFGFDKSIGPSGDVFDMVLSSVNDLPLSNLLVSTRLGKLLFPYSYGNHAAAHTYNPNLFMQNIRQALQQRSSQPLLFAAHFDITAYPFYWLNDKKYNTLNWVSLYQNTITEADRQLGIFLQLLQEQGLLEHAVFILLSDHGITFKLPNDRIVNEAFYQGDKSKIVLDRQKYSSLEMHFADDLVKNPPLDTKVIYLKQKELDTEINESKFKGLNESIPLNEKSGIDASFGYGTDILSFAIQNHPLLAFKTYGVNLGSPHTVKGRAMLLDIMPTLLDILHLPPLTETDGISLKPYLQSANLAIPKQRPIFLESCYSIDEIQKENILVGDVLKTNIT